jgi:predicted nucleic acid-binding Zn ribbon protein
MSHHRNYDYGHKHGSAEGVRRDLRRRRWGIILMLLIGILILAGLLYLTLSS